jgi:hypothetical protein
MVNSNAWVEKNLWAVSTDKVLGLIGWKPWKCAAIYACQSSHNAFTTS